VAYLAGKMDGVMEANGKTMLDNSLVIFTDGLSKGNNHSRKNIPWVLLGSAGGAMQTGKFHDFGNKPHNHLLVSILHAMGLKNETFFGHPNLKDWNGPLPGLAGLARAGSTAGPARAPKWAKSGRVLRCARPCPGRALPGNADRRTPAIARAGTVAGACLVLAGGDRRIGARATGWAPTCPGWPASPPPGCCWRPWARRCWTRLPAWGHGPGTAAGQPGGRDQQRRPPPGWRHHRRRLPVRR
jgi:hypothetical protein